MKTKTLLLSAVGIATISLFSFTQNRGTIGVYNHHDARYAAGAPIGKTGAPGENNCTQCHSGNPITNSQAATISYSGTGNTYISGSTYVMSVSLPSITNPKNGFEIVALRTSDNTNVGTWVITDATNTQTINGGGRDYVTHTPTGNMANVWNFEWTAPATGEGDIKFYLAAALTNNDGSTQNDEVHLVELLITEDASNSIVEHSEIVDIDNSFKIKQNNGFVTPSLELNQAKTATINVTGLNGQVVYTATVNLQEGNNILAPIDLSKEAKGIYVISFVIDNNIIARKVNL